ncbi:hypothetical protein EDB92DRAFT_1820253 [Lactarius akahatsu]|uniref:Uncharacterized protein n=1 Tax=Lactarius akahatsu TaxID=416441 RepID=A0AAD4L9S0_9AGAM|nr:hypothetical protein EDB92DRAFT_1820253 [Lactarius akahatsu]
MITQLSLYHPPVHGLTLASGLLGGTIRVWDASFTGSSRVENGKQEGWDHTYWSLRGRFVMALEYRWNVKEVWLWNIQDGTSRVLEDCLPGSLMAISDRGCYIAVESIRFDGQGPHDEIFITTREIASEITPSKTD